MTCLRPNGLIQDLRPYVGIKKNINDWLLMVPSMEKGKLVYKKGKVCDGPKPYYLGEIKSEICCLPLNEPSRVNFCNDTNGPQCPTTRYACDKLSSLCYDRKAFATWIYEAKLPRNIKEDFFVRFFPLIRERPEHGLHMFRMR